MHEKFVNELTDEAKEDFATFRDDYRGTALGVCAVFAASLVAWQSEILKRPSLEVVLQRSVPYAIQSMKTALVRAGFHDAAELLPAANSMDASAVLKAIHLMRFGKVRIRTRGLNESSLAELGVVSLLRKRSKVLAASLLNEDQTPMFDAQKESDIVELESLDDDLAAELYNKVLRVSEEQCENPVDLPTESDRKANPRDSFKTGQAYAALAANLSGSKDWERYKEKFTRLAKFVGSVTEEANRELQTWGLPTVQDIEDLFDLAVHTGRHPDNMTYYEVVDWAIEIQKERTIRGLIGEELSREPDSLRALTGHELDSRKQTPLKPGTPESKFEWLAKAMLIVRDEPELSNARIAKQVGKSASTLSRSREFQAAAAMARGVKSDRPKGHRKVDSDSEAYGVEAYVYDDDFDG